MEREREEGRGWREGETGSEGETGREGEGEGGEKLVHRLASPRVHITHHATEKLFPM